MKTKIILTAVFTSLIALNFVSAQANTNSCLDLKFNMKFRSNDRNTNGEVTKLQDFLAVNAYLTGTTSNGNYGPATLKAVKEFQRVNGLIVTGVVGKVTRGKVGFLSCSKSDATSKVVLTQTQDVNINNKYVSPEKSLSYKIQTSDHTLKVYSQDRIKDLDIKSVYKSGNNIVIEGSGFSRLNREPQIEDDTCLMHSSPDFSISTSDNSIVMKNYVLCLPNRKDNFVSLGMYDPSLNLIKNETYNAVYSNLIKEDSFYKNYINAGGEAPRLEYVEVYNKFLIGASFATLSTPNQRFSEEEKYKNEQLIFAENLRMCTVSKTNFKHPLTGEILSREIVSNDGNVTCNTREQMPNGGKMECKFVGVDRYSAAQEYKDLATASSFKGGIVNGVAESSYQISSGKYVKSTLQEFLNNGTCVISGY